MYRGNVSSGLNSVANPAYNVSEWRDIILFAQYEQILHEFTYAWSHPGIIGKCRAEVLLSCKFQQNITLIVALGPVTARWVNIVFKREMRTQKTGLTHNTTGIFNMKKS